MYYITYDALAVWIQSNAPVVTPIFSNTRTGMEEPSSGSVG